jgi:tRNA (mo5U34)-methyltransferase
MELPEAILKLRSVREELGQKIPLYPYSSFANVDIIEPLLSDQGTDFKSFIAGKRIADIGCGDGDMAFICEMLGARAVVALDWPDTNCNRMQGAYALHDALGSSVRIFAGNVEQMDLTLLGPQDLILFLGALYHLPNPQCVVRKLSCFGHQIIATTKVFDVLPSPQGSINLRGRQAAYFLLPREANNDDTNWWVLTETTVKLLFERSGWRVLASQRYDHVVGSANPFSPDADGRMILLANSVYV